MVFVLFIFFVIFYIYFVKLDNKNTFRYFLWVFPVALAFVVIYSLQYEVGADYWSYRELVAQKSSYLYFFLKNEYFFGFLLKITRYMGNEQLIFLFSSLIQVFFFIIAIHMTQKMNFSVFLVFLMYFSFSIGFFNQFNGIRQYIGVNIFIVASLMLIQNKKFNFLVLVSLASLFHFSVVISGFILGLNNFLSKKFNRKIMLVFLWILVVLCLLFRSHSFFVFLVKKLISMITPYSAYLSSNYSTSLGFAGVITKIPKLVIFSYCFYFVYGINNSKRDCEITLRILNLSYISALFLPLTFLSGVAWRFYQYFDFFLIFPLLVFQEKNRRKFFLIALFLILILLLKLLVFAKGEYFYQSIFSSPYF